MNRFSIGDLKKILNAIPEQYDDKFLSTCEDNEMHCFDFITNLNFEGYVLLPGDIEDTLKKLNEAIKNEVNSPKPVKEIYKPKSCWECKHCHTDNFGYFEGKHLCNFRRNMNGLVEFFSKTVDPGCPLNEEK